MLRVVAIYPAFDVRLNEMAMVWQHLCQAGKVQCMAIAGSQDTLKSKNTSKVHESHANLEIFRFPKLIPSMEILSLCLSFQPHVIFFGVHSNIRLARSIHKSNGKPIVFHTEFFLDDGGLLNRKHYLGIPALRRPCANGLRWYLHTATSLTLVSNPIEKGSSEWLKYKRVRYLPWPHPDQVHATALRDRQRNLSVYAGSISQWKGGASLLHNFRALLEAEPDFRLKLIGPAVDDFGARVLNQLLERYPGQVISVRHADRSEVLNLLGQSLFTFSPGSRYGWGLIGDSWGAGTPILAINEHYDLQHMINCLVVDTPERFVHAVRSLQSDEKLWNRLSEAGTKTVADHSIEAVAENLIACLYEAVGK